MGTEVAVKTPPWDTVVVVVDVGLVVKDKQIELVD